MKRIVILLAAAVLLLAACSRSDKIPLKSLPDGYSLEDAKADGCVVYEDGDVTSGQSVWDDFVKTVNRGKAAEVRLAFYYTLGDPAQYDPKLYEELKDDYPQIYVKDLSYNGETYTIRGYVDGELISREYPHLVKYEGGPLSKTAVYSKYTYYVLVNDENVTWDDIHHGMFSSFSGDWIDHYRVYSDLVLK